jgi:hypothetical protein
VKDAINSAIPLLTAQVSSPLILCPNNGGSFISVTFMCVRTSTPYFILQCHSSARSTRLFFPYSENIPFAALIGLHLPCLVSLCAFIFLLCLGYASTSWEAKERSRLVPKYNYNGHQALTCPCFFIQLLTFLLCLVISRPEQPSTIFLTLGLPCGVF